MNDVHRPEAWEKTSPGWDVWCPCGWEISCTDRAQAEDEMNEHEKRNS